MRGLTRFACAALLIAACARMAAPPGGPPRAAAPVLVSTYPDSAVVPNAFRGVAEFRFDEVITEGQPNFGYGTGDLEKLVLLSPDTAVPTVRWRRDRITVRPRDGWQPNTVYRIELAPGVSDLRRNISKESAVIVFATGGPAPTRTLSGRAVDWASRHGSPGALIEAFHLPDSVRYRTVADSTGRFHLDRLPGGSYLVVATIDQNRDHLRGPNEAWDTVRVSVAIDTAGEIWAFARDTLPARIQDVTRQDSQSIAVTFRSPIDPSLHLDSASIRVLLLPDSGTIGPIDAYPKARYDSVYKPVPKPRTPSEDSIARADSIKADSVQRAAPRPVPSGRGRGAAPPPTDEPKQVRPPLGNSIVIRTLGRVQLGTSYYVELRNVRTAGGVTGPPVGRRLDTPKPPSAADSLKALSDSLKADSLRRVKPDSAAKARADSLKADSLLKRKKPPAR